MCRKICIELKSRYLQLVIRDELPGNPLIAADPDKIRMVFQNLIGNAVKYAAGERNRCGFRVTGCRNGAAHEQQPSKRENRCIPSIGALLRRGKLAA